MAIYLTLDGGTTNTRISLVREGRVCDTVRFPIGARASIDSTEPLTEAIRDGISTLLERNALQPSDVLRVIASGMITCEHGLCPLEHIPLPAGVAELNATAKEVLLPGITPIPFLFIRGLRQKGDDYLSTDLIRGEETELAGLWREDTELYLLPGSHSKAIRTDREGRVISFSTFLTGEMLAALSQGTILKSSVTLRDQSPDKEFLLMGYDCCHTLGINRALFKVRILDTQYATAPEKLYSFFLGAVLASEIDAILEQDFDGIAIGGRLALREAYRVLLSQRGNKRVTLFSETEVDESTALGAVRIAEFAKN